MPATLTDEGLQRLLDDLATVPLVKEEDVERLQDGRWLYESCCARCGGAYDQRNRCVACQNRHEKRRQRRKRSAPAPLLGTPRSHV